MPTSKMFAIALPFLVSIVSSAELTTLLKGRNMTSIEDRLTNLETTIESRLLATERVLGQLLTGRSDADLTNLNVLSLRSGILNSQLTPVLFSAYKSFGEGSISTKVTIRFDKTYINLGDHYHTEDGIFIAPETGVYLFHWTIATAGSPFSTQHSSCFQSYSSPGWIRFRLSDGYCQRHKRGPCLDTAIWWFRACVWGHQLNRKFLSIYIYWNPFTQILGLVCYFWFIYFFFFHIPRTYLDY